MLSQYGTFCRTRSMPAARGPRIASDAVASSPTSIGQPALIAIQAKDCRPQQAAISAQNRPPTHDAMSKNMKASAFSCGVRSAWAPQLVGYGWTTLFTFTGPPETCMSENTTLPQRWSDAFSLGVVNWKFWVNCVVASFCQ